MNKNSLTGESQVAASCRFVTDGLAKKDFCTFSWSSAELTPLRSGRQFPHPRNQAQNFRPNSWFSPVRCHNFGSFQDSARWNKPARSLWFTRVQPPSEQRYKTPRSFPWTGYITLFPTNILIKLRLCRGKTTFSSWYHTSSASKEFRSDMSKTSIMPRIRPKPCE